MAVNDRDEDGAYNLRFGHIFLQIRSGELFLINLLYQLGTHITNYLILYQ